MNPIAQKIIAIIADYCGHDGSHLTEDSHLEEDCGLDSLDQIELAIDLQSEFEVVVTDEEIGSASRISDLVRIITQKTNP